MMKLKTLFISALLVASPFASAGKYLCSYTAQISESDKYNSSGNYLGKSYTKSSVANILRQDRANFYVFGVRDYYDTADCTMHSKNQRAIFERLLNNSQIPRSFIKQVIDGNPIIDIHLYQNHIEASIRMF